MEESLVDNVEKMTAYWDPVYGEITEEEVAQCSRMRTEFASKFAYYRANPDAIRKNIVLCFLLAVCIWLGLFILFRGAINGGNIQAFILGLVPPSMYYFQIKKLEEKMIKSLLAEKEGWLYDPSESVRRWEVLDSAFSEIFHKGDHGQRIYDQFWGLFRERIPFWAGNFRYTIGHGKNSRSYKEMIYAFYLPERVAHDLVLRPQSLVRKIENRFEMGLTTESNDFNELFHIDFEGRPGDVGAAVFEVLSPDAQEKLIAMHGDAGEFTLLFRSDVMVIAFRHWEKFAHHTDFTVKVELDRKDVEELSAKMDSIMGLADAILPCVG